MSLTLSLRGREDDTKYTLYFPEGITAESSGGIKENLSEALAATQLAGKTFTGILPDATQYDSTWDGRFDNVEMVGATNYYITQGSISHAGSFNILSVDGYVYPKNGRYVRLLGAGSGIVAVYDRNDTLLAQIEIGNTSTYLDAYCIPRTIGKDMTLAEWRALVTYTQLQPYTWVDVEDVLIPNKWQTGKGALINSDHTIDWIYYLLHDPNKDTDIGEEDDDPYSGDDSPYEPAGPGGGDGDGEDPYEPGDNNPIPDEPPFSISDTGLMSVYIPSNATLNLLAGYLWSSNFITSLVKDLYADPMDVIISLGILPFQLVAAGTKNIKVGDRDSGVSSAYPRDKYYLLDCGSIQLKTTIGAYIDYAPYTRGDIYIPFVGMVPLDIDAFMKHTIGLKYRVEICTGAAVAFLTRDGDVWQTFACNLMTPVPLSSANYSQMWQTVVGATAALAGAGAAGATGMGAAATAGESVEGAQMTSGELGNEAKAASGIMSAAATKPTIQKTNNISVLAGILANRKPYILLHRPNLMLPTGQNKYQGYPSYIGAKLNTLHGYTRVSSVNLAVPSATSEEITMIDSILKTGFIIGSGTPLTGSGIVLGKNNSPNHQINKNVSTITTLTGTFRDSVNIISPTVRIEYNNPITFNYVYISAFARRYFVTDINIVRKGILDVSLRVDPLDSFATEILNNAAIIDKQENNYNLYLNDDSLKMRQDPLVTLLKFPSGMFENNQYTNVLLVAGN